MKEEKNTSQQKGDKSPKCDVYSLCCGFINHNLHSVSLGKNITFVNSAK